MSSSESSLWGGLSAHSYKPHLLGGMLIAVGGRAKDLLFGVEPKRSNIEEIKPDFASSATITNILKKET
jgi:hypothetical protein